MTVGEVRNKPRMGRVPIVPFVYCAACGFVLFQRREPWQGEPIWIQCRKCRHMNRVSVDGVWIVTQPGDIQPKNTRLP